MIPDCCIALDKSPRTDRDELEWAAAHTPHCGSKCSCIKERTCLGLPVCEALAPLGTNAGFVAPTSSAFRCGHCVLSFGGAICFCPMRWCLHRMDGRQASIST
jgi:hypothetical protein